MGIVLLRSLVALMRLSLTLLVLLLSAAMCPSAATEEHFNSTVQPLLKRFCFGCHGPEKQKSQIRYDQIKDYRVADQHLWAMAHEQLIKGAMPPEESPAPTESERKVILAWIEQQAAAARKKYGAGTTRRLNRREVSGALQDLTGLAVDYSDALPGDGKVAGFDTAAEGLQDAADSISQFMKVSRAAVDGIRFLEPANSKRFEANLRTATDPKKAIDAWKAMGASANTGGSQRGLGLLMEPRWVGDRDALSFTVPAPADRSGVLRLKLVVSAMKPSAAVPNPHLWVEVGAKDIAYREITATFDAPQEIVFEIQVDDLAMNEKGLKINLSNKVEIPYAVEGFENDDNSKPEDKLPGGIGLYRPRFDRKALTPDKQPVPYIVLQQVEIDTDYVAPWPHARWPEKLAPISDNLESATRLLNLWMERAIRRPIRPGESERYLALYQKLRSESASFDEALRAAFQSVLLSSGFRYLPSTSDPDPVVVQHAIASRLSFMLWCAPPDEALRKLAASGKLRETATLDAQADRLIADPRSDAFFRPFIMQWLEMDQPITIAMDHIKKQDFRFGRHLKASMREETIGYIAQLITENRPARELIVSDWTLMNNILAIHYGYPAIDGSALRKVKLRPDDPRGGGILGHAGIQSMLCWMGENWVIYRGSWTLRHILNEPLPPPPLDVPELNPSAGGNKGKPFRELLKQHQADPNCSMCHRKMDPMGFAFQNFDLSGRWRELEYESYSKNELDGKIAWIGTGKSRPVDSVGRLPRGEEFKTFAQCRQLIADNYREDVVRGLMKNLVIYAAGRQADALDMTEIRKAINENAAKGHQLRDLLKAVLKLSWLTDPPADVPVKK
jgi:hypothetical protein